MTTGGRIESITLGGKTFKVKDDEKDTKLSFSHESINVKIKPGMSFWLDDAIPHSPLFYRRPPGDHRKNYNCLLLNDYYMDGSHDDLLKGLKQNGIPVMYIKSTPDGVKMGSKKGYKAGYRILDFGTVFEWWDADE